MKIKNNDNINLSRLNKDGYNNMLYIEFIPYNREITKEYIKSQLKQIFKQVKEDFVLYSQEFNFNGLNETNRDLIEKGCNIYSNYYGDYITFEGVEK